MELIIYFFDGRYKQNIESYHIIINNIIVLLGVKGQALIMEHFLEELLCLDIGRLTQMKRITNTNLQF